MKKEEKTHLSKVAAIGCIVCKSIGYNDTPAEIHHIRTGVGKGQRASHFRVLPLCPHHHRNGGHGEAFHAGPKTWQENFGTELDLLDRVLSQI
jgi:hypothetical protein